MDLYFSADPLNRLHRIDVYEQLRNEEIMSYSARCSRYEADNVATQMHYFLRGLATPQATAQDAHDLAVQIVQQAYETGILEPISVRFQGENESLFTDFYPKLPE